MSRYLERAENTARFLEVNWYMSLDQAPNQEFQQWEPLVQVTGDNKLFADRYDQPIKQNVIQFLTLDTEYPNSIISCLRAARENARTVRDIISAELWEQINMLHHEVEEMADNPEDLTNNPYDFCRDVKLRGMMLGGTANDTMNHTEGWHFFRWAACWNGPTRPRASLTSNTLSCCRTSTTSAPPTTTSSGPRCCAPPMRSTPIASTTGASPRDRLPSS